MTKFGFFLILLVLKVSICSSQLKEKYEIGYEYYSGLSGGKYKYFCLELKNDSNFNWTTVDERDAAFSSSYKKKKVFSGHFTVIKNELRLYFTKGDSTLEFMNNNYSQYKIKKSKLVLKNKGAVRKELEEEFVSYLDSKYELKEIKYSIFNYFRSRKKPIVGIYKPDI